VRHGHQVTVLTTDALTQTTRYSGDTDEIINGVRVIRISNFSHHLRGRLNLSTPDKMHLIAREILPDFDVVHCHEFRTVENLLVTPVAAELGKPLILSPHGTLTRDTGRSQFKAIWDRLLSPVVAQRFDWIVGLTQHEVEEAQSLWASFGRHSPGFSVIPNGIDPQEYAHLNGGESFRRRFHLDDQTVCLFMSRLHSRKGVHILVQAFKHANIPDARLVIAGPDEGMREVITPELDERMIVTGFLDGVDRLAAFAAADVLALPAVGEGLPMVVLEAMGAGLPVIVSPGCNIPEVEEYHAGIEVDAAVEPLAQALRTLLTDPHRQQEMGMAAQQLVRDHFTWDSVAVKLEQLYRSMV
ncbi:MAG: glycosyltransferase, partial [Anaerolineae bacterium]|nr:glycosyltransferase [Anaerolineae bacterium]